jgi:NADH:ubiquinone oxidoreductase subunit E
MSMAVICAWTVQAAILTHFESPMKKILVCTNYRANPNNSSCAARGSEVILTMLQQTLRQDNMPIGAEPSPCMGFCEKGPNAHLTPGGPFLHEITMQNWNKVIEEAKNFLKGS